MTSIVTLILDVANTINPLLDLWDRLNIPAVATLLLAARASRPRGPREGQD